MNFLNVYLGPYHALPIASNIKFTDHLKPKQKEYKQKHEQIK